MNPNDPNVAMMELVADRLGEALRHELVFVGGAVAGLLITDPAQPAIRPTEDVDLLVETAIRADYHRVEDALRRRGFVNDTSKDAPICRWRIDTVVVDVMPTLKDILGFSNRWYPLALATARPAGFAGASRCAAGPPPGRCGQPGARARSREQAAPARGNRLTMNASILVQQAGCEPGPISRWSARSNGDGRYDRRAADAKP